MKNVIFYEVYCSYLRYDKPMKWLCGRAILTAKNDQAAAINDSLQMSFVEEEIVYTSTDTVINNSVVR